MYTGVLETGDSVGDGDAARHFTGNADVLVTAAVLEMVSVLEMIFGSRELLSWMLLNLLALEKVLAVEVVP